LERSTTGAPSKESKIYSAMTDTTIEPVMIPIKIKMAKARPRVPKNFLTGPRRFAAAK